MRVVILKDRIIQIITIKNWIEIQQGLEQHSFKLHGPWRCMFLNWIQKYLRSTFLHVFERFFYKWVLEMHVFNTWVLEMHTTWNIIKDLLGLKMFYSNQIWYPFCKSKIFLYNMHVLQHLRKPTLLIFIKNKNTCFIYVSKYVQFQISIK